MATKAETIDTLNALKIEHDPDALKSELEALIPKDVEESNKKDVPAPSEGTVTRKIEQSELISIQKEGKLVGYDSKTRMGIVRKDGDKRIEWPEGADPKAS